MIVGPGISWSHLQSRIPTPRHEDNFHKTDAVISNMCQKSKLFCIDRGDLCYTLGSYLLASSNSRSIVAIVCLCPYHCSRICDPSSLHIQNNLIEFAVRLLLIVGDVVCLCCLPEIILNLIHWHLLL